MEIIRGRLSAADFSPPNLRYNPDCDCVQFTPDDGTTWVDAPSADPRHSDLYRLPVLTTTDPRCDAAANMVKWMKDFIDSLTALLEAGATAFTLINTALELMSAIFNPSILLLAIAEVCDTLFGIGSAALLAAFTSDQYDLLLCCFYCNIESDGSCTPVDLVGIETQVTADLNGIASLVVNLIFAIQGEVGVSNAGVVGGQTGDCSSCDCPPGCHEWSGVGDTGVDATYTYRGFASTLTPSVSFTRITIDWQLNPNPGATLIQADVRVFLSGGGLPSYIQSILSDTGEFVIVFPTPSTESAFNIVVRSAFSGGSNYPDLTLVRFDYLPDASISWVGGSDCS